MDDYLSVLQHFIANTNIDRQSIASVERQLVHHLNQANNPQAVAYLITPGHRRIRQWLEAHNFSIGVLKNQTVIFNGWVDPELRYQQHSEAKGTVAPRGVPTMTPDQLKGSYSYNEK